MEDFYKSGKHVSWRDFEESTSKYNMLSSRFENALKPLTVAEMTDAEPDLPQKVRESITSIENVRKSSDALRKELDLISSKRNAQEPSSSLKKKHESLLAEMMENEFEISPQHRKFDAKPKDLSWEDIITNQTVKSFLERYHPGNEKIPTKDFIDYLEFEFPQ